MIHPDDVLILESGGGGGWGDPAERDPAGVASDIKNGFVSDGCPHDFAPALSPPIPSPASGGGLGWEHAGEGMGGG